MRTEPDNCVDKYAVCVEKDKKGCWTFKERRIWEVYKNHFLLPEK